MKSLTGVGWGALVVAVGTALVGVGAVKAHTDANQRDIAELKVELYDRSLSLEKTGAGRLLLEKLDTIDKRIQRIEADIKDIKEEQKRAAHQSSR